MICNANIALCVMSVTSVQYSMECKKKPEKLNSAVNDAINSDEHVALDK